MSLSNLFRVNFPYGIQFNTVNNSLAFFNREYGQLGTNKTSDCDLKNLEKIETKYKGLSLDKITEIVQKHLDYPVSTSKQGNTVCIFFYDDKTNPSNKGNSYTNYFKILEELANYKVVNEIKTVERVIVTKQELNSKITKDTECIVLHDFGNGTLRVQELKSNREGVIHKGYYEYI